MALFNHATKELTAKIVYYGPGLCGKTSNLTVLHQRLERGAGKLLSLSTAQERTIYFDLLPIELGNVRGYSVRFQLCTVPGQVFHNETRRIVLRGVDGLVFVVDSQWSMLSHNLESFQNLKENLHGEEISFETLPIVIQYNKRDLPSALSVEALQDSLDFRSYPYVEAVATEGTGVVETFKLVSKLTFVDLLRRLQRGWQPPSEAPEPVADEAPAGFPEEAPVFAFAGTNDEPGNHEPASLEPAILLAALAAPLAVTPAPLEPPPLEPPPSEPLPPEPALPPRAPAMPAHGRASSVDEKLNAVLAEARKAAGRMSGSYRRPEPPEGNTQEIPGAALPELRLEEAIAGLRAEMNDEIARLRAELAAALAVASSAETAASQAAERARRLEDVLREALRGLAL